MNRLNGFPGVEPHAGGVVLSCVWEGKMGDGVGWASGGRGVGKRQTGSKGVYAGSGPEGQAVGWSVNHPGRRLSERDISPITRNHPVMGWRWGVGGGRGLEMEVRKSIKR